MTEDEKDEMTAGLVQELRDKIAVLKKALADIIVKCDEVYEREFSWYATEVDDARDLLLGT